MSSEGNVRILHGALDKEGDFIVLRGRIDPDTLEALLVDDYQREVLPASTIGEILSGFRKNDGAVPDIDLGMRGAQYHAREGAFILRAPVYIVDGLQRVTAAKKFREQGGAPILGATIHFNTTKKWEIGRFRTLNASRLRLSPNVLLRNTRDENAGMDLLYWMSAQDGQFVMKERVCWQQRKQRVHLVTAMTLARCICQLHAYLAPGLASATNVDQVATAVLKLYELVGRNTLRDNVRQFFQLINDCWGVRSVTYSESAAHLRHTFLLTLARVLDNHERFWKERKLFVETDLVKKFTTFPIQDPTVQQLSGSSGQATKYLYNLFVDHLNKGKRTKRLKERRATAEPVVVTERDEALETELAGVNS